MANFYTGLANTANSLLKDKGQDVTVARKVKSYDPITAETTVTSSFSQTLNGAVFSKSSSNFDTSLQEEKIKGNRKSVLLSTVGSTFVPEIDDEVSFDNELWKAYGVTKLSPAGTNVIYKVGVMFLKVLDQPKYTRPDGASLYVRPSGGNYLQPITL